jgi:hypothetical protein
VFYVSRFVKALSQRNFDDFVESWMSLDPEGKGELRSDQLVQLIDGVPAPLGAEDIEMARKTAAIVMRSINATELTRAATDMARVGLLRHTSVDMSAAGQALAAAEDLQVHCCSQDLWYF